jgi:hypothetical protein
MESSLVVRRTIERQTRTRQEMYKKPRSTICRTI